jgi:hypothetical protein
VVVNSFALPGGTLYITANPGNNAITIRRMAPGSDSDVVLLNNVPIFTGTLESIAGGIQIVHDSDVDDVFNNGTAVPTGENDTLFLDFSNGNPFPAGGVTFMAASGGNNLIRANADANYVLGDTGLAIGGLGTVTLANVANANLAGGPSNNLFTLSNWSGFATIDGGGASDTVQVAAGTVLTSHLTLANVQTVQVSGGTLTVDSNFSVASLQNQVQGTLTLAQGVTLTSNVLNAGNLNPGGASPGAATIAGNFTQTSTGVLNIRLGGLNQFDQLNVTGQATLDGTLSVMLVNGYSPNVGDSFPILTYAAETGDFATATGLNLGNGKKLNRQLGANSLVLVTVSSP